MTRRNRHPRFNGSADDHAATELLASITPAPEDQAAIDRVRAAGYASWDHPDRFAGRSDLGVMPGGVVVVEVTAPAPLDRYRPAPASFPALQAAPEPEPAPVLAAVPVTEPAVIGDAIRLPVIWCEMGGCISWFLDEDAAGYADARQRALAAGWRTDAKLRFACPPCQQTRADYDTPRPVAWHHPEVHRRWYEHGQRPGDDTLHRLGVEAELGRRVSWEDPALARAIAGATHRTAAS